MMDMYAENILEHYKNPHHCGSLNDPTATAEDANPFCGDKYQLELKIKDGVIEDAKFDGEGCAISKSALSMLMDEIIGKKVEDVEKIDKEKIYEMMGVDLGAARVKCALLGLVILKKAIINLKKDEV
jgi:nitrogen fixation NifU-like protein